MQVTVRVAVRVTLQSATRLQSVYITLRDYTSCLLFYFYVLRKYYHTHKDGGVLDNPYSSQLLHTSEYGVVLGTPIQDYQREIPLRESRIRVPL